MKHAFTIIVLALAPTLASAQPTKTISCSFTEPFFTLDVDLEKKTVTRTEPNWDSQDLGTKVTVIAEGISLAHDFSDPLAPTFAIVSAGGSAILDLSLDMQGSDGMSDVIFPFSARHGGMWGGCESDKLKGHDPHAR